MSHIVDATCENGILKLDQPLPLKDQKKVRLIIESLTEFSAAFPAEVASGDLWNDERNQRRCELIDKHIEETISESERHELDRLQSQMREYRVAPFPTEGALRLQGKLAEVY